MDSQTLTLLALLLFPLTCLGILNILPSLHTRPAAGTRKPGSPSRLLIVLGSGGHTAAMLTMLHDIDTTKYTHRSYLVSSGDELSAAKAVAFEARINPAGTAQLAGAKAAAAAAAANAHRSQRFEYAAYVGYDVVTVPRARRVHQSLLTTPFSALRCLWASMMVLHGHHIWPPMPGLVDHHEDDPVYPDLILVNGPGTAMVVVLASFCIRFLWLPGSGGKMRTVYVESWARVKRLSLSGRLLLKLVDRFVVQWETLLTATGSKGEYYGPLVR